MWDSAPQSRTDSNPRCVCYKSSSKKCSLWGFPSGSVDKNPPAKAGDVGLIPDVGRCSGEGNGNPLQYLCMGNPMDRGAWRAIAHGVAKESDTT